MADISEQTRLEMEAGARHLAHLNGTDLPPEYMEGIIRTQMRHAQLKKWERENKVEIEIASIAVQGNDYKPSLLHRTVVHVMGRDKRRFAAFEDLIAEQRGGWPSEVLMANVALALQAEGLL